MNAILLTAVLSLGQVNDLLGATHDNTLITSTYMQMATEAIAKNQSLLVFLNCSPRAVPGFLSVSRAGTFDGRQEPGIFVSRPSLWYPGELDNEGVLKPEATDAEIRAVLARPQKTPPPASRQPSRSPTQIEWGVSQQASPFYRLALVHGEPNVDADTTAPVGRPWPEGVPFIRGLVRYEPAKLTQRSHDRELFGYASGWIEPISRYSLPSKWHQPGGLEGVAGWRSDLYKLNAGGWTWRGKTKVDEAFPPATFQRSYGDGTLFVDVLSNAATGKVFELRAREKSGGVWHSYVPFRDKVQWPLGYAGLRGQTCASCHEESGTGAYGKGYVLGGDTVLSEPLKGLE